MEVNCNHVAAKRSGKLLAMALRKHKGKTSEVWTIDITDEDDTLIALAHMTMAIKKNDKIIKIKDCLEILKSRFLGRLTL